MSRLLHLREALIRALLSFLGLLNHAAQFMPLGRLPIRPLQFNLKVWVSDLRSMIDSWNLQEDPFHRALQFLWDTHPLRHRYALPPPP